MTKSHTPSNKKPAFIAYSVKGNGEDAFWNRVGAAWYHKDGSGLSITLAAMPIEGRIVLRVPRPSPSRGA